jgi:hypothetical protein
MHVGGNRSPRRKPTLSERESPTLSHEEWVWPGIELTTSEVTGADVICYICVVWKTFRCFIEKPSGFFQRTFISKNVSYAKKCSTEFTDVENSLCVVPVILMATSQNGGAQKLRKKMYWIPKLTDMTIHWKALEEHLHSFLIHQFWENAFSEYFSKNLSPEF